MSFEPLGSPRVRGAIASDQRPFRLVVSGRGLRNRSGGAGSAALLTRIHQMFQGTSRVRGAHVHRRLHIDLAVPLAIGDPVEPSCQDHQTWGETPAAEWS